jgi:hypothetical protein
MLMEDTVAAALVLLLLHCELLSQPRMTKRLVFLLLEHSWPGPQGLLEVVSETTWRLLDHTFKCVCIHGVHVLHYFTYCSSYLVL